MLFARLLEKQRAAVATEAMLEGAGVSALAHALLIGGWLFFGRGIERVRPEPAEVFTPVEYLIPKDRLAGMRPVRETVTFTTLAANVGEGFAGEQARAEPRDAPRLEVVMPKGKTDDTDAAPKAEEAQKPIALGDSIMTELQVDSAVVCALPSARYPTRGKARHDVRTGCGGDADTRKAPDHQREDRQLLRGEDARGSRFETEKAQQRA